jgi:hypothetical protein
MRKIALAFAAVAMLSAGSLITNPAEATTLGTSAGMRLAVDAVQPAEQVHYRYYPRRYRYGFYPRFRAYAFYPRPYYRAYAFYPRPYYYAPYYRRYHYGYY